MLIRLHSEFKNEAVESPFVTAFLFVEWRRLLAALDWPRDISALRRSCCGYLRGGESHWFVTSVVAMRFFVVRLTPPPIPIFSNSVRAASDCLRRCDAVITGAAGASSAFWEATNLVIASRDVYRNPPIRMVSSLMPRIPWSRHRCKVARDSRRSMPGNADRASENEMIVSAFASIVIPTAITDTTISTSTTESRPTQQPMPAAITHKTEKANFIIVLSPMYSMRQLNAVCEGGRLPAKRKPARILCGPRFCSFESVFIRLSPLLFKPHELLARLCRPL